jgi:polysaccharide export outer membrane protein
VIRTEVKSVPATARGRLPAAAALLPIVAVAIFALGQARAEEPAPALRMSSVLATAPTGAPASPAAAAVPRNGYTRTGMRDYRIGPEDLIDIQVFGVDQLSRSLRVNARGSVSLPLVGAVEVAGLTAQEAETAIASRLADNFLQDPQVTVFIKEYTSQRVTIEGAVLKPGIYPLRGQTTLLRSLAVAGGQGQLSDMTEVMLFRESSGKRETFTYDIEKIRRGEIEDPVVVNDDLIVVNRSKGRVVFRDSILSDVITTLNPFRWAP